jgi:hypothetical protein
MWCPHCESADTKERRERTALGYRRLRCHTCKREFIAVCTCMKRLFLGSLSLWSLD